MAGRVTSPVFVGRGSESAVLDAALERATAGSAATVLVGGEAGIGKTRLVAEFVDRAHTIGTRVLSGGCISLGADEGLPFAPIAAALRGLVRDLGPETLAGLLDASTNELGSLVPELGRADDQPSSRPDWAQTRVFEGLFTLLERLGSVSPVILVIEDLHWADRSTRDVIAFLARSLRSERVLLVATYRSDDLHRRHPLRPWLAEMDRIAGVTRVELDRLTPGDVRRQLEAIIGRIPDAALVDAIVRRAAGNPFFTEELLAAGATGADDHLPESLRDVLLVRIEALSEPTQAVLGAAAVAGPSFDHDLLLAACELDEAVVSENLREAVAAQLVVSDAASGSFAFRHALVQEAVYDDLLPRARRRAHARIAAALAVRPVPDGADGASHLASLAHHATAAHDLPLALRGWVDAARASARVYALAEAAYAYERALDLWDAVPADDRPQDIDVVQILYEASLTLIGSGQLLRARDVAGQAVERFDPATDPLRAALVRERYARALWLAGELTTSLEVLDEAVELCRDQPTTPESARVVASLAGTLVLKDHNARSIEVGREAVALARAIGARHVEAYAICGLGTALANAGDCEEGLALLREAVALAHELQLTAIDFHRTYSNLSTCLHTCGDLEEAVAVAMEGVEWARSRGLWRLQGSFLEANAAASMVELGRWSEAQSVLDRRDRPTTEGVALLNHVVVAGPLAVRTGRLAEARSLLLDAQRGVAGLRDAQFTGPIYGGLVELAIAEGRHRDATTLTDEAVERMAGSETLGMRYRVELQTLALHADALAIADARARRDGEGEAAARRDAAERIGAIRAASTEPAGPANGLAAEVRGFAAIAEAEFGQLDSGPDPAVWAEAARVWERIGRPWPRARCLLAEAEAILATRGSRADAAARLIEAHAIAARLGAVPLQAACETLARLARIDLGSSEATDGKDGATKAAEADPAGPTSFGLTERELEVLRLLADGYSNRRIGEALFISESTAGVHVSNILGKLGVSNRVEAAAIAVRVGLAD